ncbi:terminase small subunit [Prevotella sp. 10(H)]|uniref:terminase small subunit n=1 Tax=Prevotella sp. 10(H) TaxID=1158294 RepID=UPI00069075E2|nr:terminase small subunit [Prevotella sp. 10(H)]
MITDSFKTRKKGGREQLYTDPDKLLTKAFEYFAWCDSNPWQRKELMRSGELKGGTVEVPVSRPYTLAGLCSYCGISQYTFSCYGKNEEMKDAASHILGIIRNNYLEGAILGEYNATFVANLLEDLY